MNKNIVEIPEGYEVVSSATFYDNTIITKLQRIVEPKSEGLSWVPREGEKFWFASAHGTVRSSVNDWAADRGCIAVGNYYCTEAEAKTAATEMKLQNHLRKLASALNGDWVARSYDSKYRIICGNGEYSIAGERHALIVGVTYFRSQEAAQTALDYLREHGLLPEIS